MKNLKWILMMCSGLGCLAGCGEDSTTPNADNAGAGKSDSASGEYTCVLLCEGNEYSRVQVDSVGACGPRAFETVPRCPYETKILDSSTERAAGSGTCTVTCEGTAWAEVEVANEAACVPTAFTTLPRCPYEVTFHAAQANDECANKVCGEDCTPEGGDEPFACNVAGDCVSPGHPLNCDFEECADKVCGEDCTPEGSDEPFSCNVGGVCVPAGQENCELIDIDPSPIRTCNGVSDVCPDGQYCDYAPEDNCGANNSEGVCRERPVDCVTLEVNPVCGCDGRDYGNTCAAQAAGVSVAHLGSCQ